MKKLFALIIGINDYPIFGHELMGCVPDAQAFHDFLKDHCRKQNIEFVPKTLFDEEAKRQAVIDAFAHFEPATDPENHLCVFFYSGHGSQMRAPKEFWEDYDRRLESMVCWDSRLEGGRDLTDKEIAYLLWKYTKKPPKPNAPEKQLHVLNIFDCCHSGSISRSTERRPNPLIVSRMAEENPVKIALEDLEGYQEYLPKGGGLVPPVADYITLSAARSYESAYEMPIGGTPRGIFTNSLLDVLENTNLSFITYGELMSRVQTRVHNQNTEQSPQHPVADIYGQLSADTLFLNGQMSLSPRTYLKYDKNDGWIIDMGAIHQVFSGAKVILEVNGKEQSTEVTKVWPGRSVVEEKSWMRKEDQEYLIKNLEVEDKTLKIGFNPALKDEAVKKKMRSFIDSSGKLQLDEEKAKYWINLVADRGYVLTRPREEMPVFESIPAGEEKENSPSPIARFIDNVEKVANWEITSELENPLAQYRVEDLVEIGFYEVLEMDEDGNALEKEERDTGKEEVFSYRYERGEWVGPAFMLSIKNISDKDLWVAGLYLGEDFSITDSFFRARELPAGAGATHFTFEGGNTIELWLPDEIFEWGVTEVVNKIKLLISTEEFTTQEFNQAGLKLEPLRKAGGAKRGGGGRRRKGPQWLVKDINLRIHRPLEAQTLPQGAEVTVQGLTIEGHPGFSAEGVQLATSSQAARSVGAGIPVLALENVFPINLGSSRNTGQPLDVIELHKVQGADQITADQPLKLRLQQDLGEHASVLPLGLDQETGLYFPLGYMDQDGVIRIEQMPDPSSPTAKGFVNSFKIYLKGLFYEKVLQQSAPYPILAVAETKDEQSPVEYLSDEATVRSRVAEADTILIMLHGLIGETKDKVSLLRRAKRTVDGKTEDLTSVYDLLLTFDYESLSTPIEQTARDFKARLEAAGIKPGHGKKVHLIAHSMGGLVSRWYLEKDGGDQVIDHFIQVGCPNLGSPWAKAYDLLNFSLGKLINFLPIPGTINEIFKYLGKVKEDIEVTITQLQPDSDFLKELNTNAVAPIPYTIIPGDSSLIPQKDERQEKLIKRYLQRFQGAYRSRMELLFKDKSDDIVGVSSMLGVPANGKVPPRKLDPVGCDHFSYFVTEPGVDPIGEVLFGLQ